MTSSNLPLAVHPAALHAGAPPARPLANFALGKSAYVVGGSYERARSTLYALGAQSVASQMMGAGMFVFEYPHLDSIAGLFVEAGIDARTGLAHGAAVTRVWT